VVSFLMSPMVVRVFKSDAVALFVSDFACYFRLSYGSRTPEAELLCGRSRDLRTSSFADLDVLSPMAIAAVVQMPCSRLSPKAASTPD
jgi:hypothetical protein